MAMIKIVDHEKISAESILEVAKEYGLNPCDMKDYDKLITIIVKRMPAVEDVLLKDIYDMCEKKQAHILN